MGGCKPGLRKRLALDIFSDLYRDTVAAHRLDTLFWECTLRCNLACRHCGSDCRSDAAVPDMPLEEFLRVLDEEISPHVDPREGIRRVTSVPYLPCVGSFADRSWRSTS